MSWHFVIDYFPLYISSEISKLPQLDAAPPVSNNNIKTTMYQGLYTYHLIQLL